MKLRLSRLAERDLAAVLGQSFRQFGRRQSDRYFEIIRTGLAMIADEPFRLSSKPRDDLKSGVRSLHLQLAAKRQGGASHVLYYTVMPAGENEDQVLVLRLLADEMAPKSRVVHALRSRKNPD